MSNLIVLDVGHGNCAILRSGSASAVIDAPIGSLLLDTLKDLDISHVDAVFVSHADHDHLAGILALLTSREVTISNLFLNADAGRRSSLWTALRAAVSVAERSGTVRVHTSLSTTTPGSVRIGEALVRVAAPSASLTLTAVGGITPHGDSVTANTLSAVLNISVNNSAGVLLAGDLDEVGLQDALHHGADLRANVLVFPHHGGSSGRDPEQFAGRLLEAVSPRAVYFSNGRNRFSNPRPGIVRRVRGAGCSVACAQLARACSDRALDSGHLEQLRAHGAKTGGACAGSISFELEGGARRALPQAQVNFSRFVAAQVPSPMCMSDDR